MERLSPAQIAGGAVGLIVGLLIAFLIKSIVFEIISGIGMAGIYVAIVLYLLVAIFAAYLGARVGARIRVVPGSTGQLGFGSRDEDRRYVGYRRRTYRGNRRQRASWRACWSYRVSSCASCRALPDSTDSLKRTRGRRGFDVLSKLQELAVVEISERDFADMAPGNVDARLVRLAQELGAKLITNDYNLNRVAHVEGIPVLNVNELANAVKPVVLPGEELHVQVTREG